MSNIHGIILNDTDSSNFDDLTQPKLRLAMVEKEVFIAVVKSSDTNLHYHADLIGEVAVNITALRAALDLLENS